MELVHRTNYWGREAIESSVANDEHDVDALCRAFPKRCKKLDDAQGGRLSY